MARSPHNGQAQRCPKDVVPSTVFIWQCCFVGLCFPEQHISLIPNGSAFWHSSAAQSTSSTIDIALTLYYQGKGLHAVINCWGGNCAGIKGTSIASAAISDENQPIPLRRPCRIMDRIIYLLGWIPNAALKIEIVLTYLLLDENCIFRR